MRRAAIAWVVWALGAVGAARAEPPPAEAPPAERITLYAFFATWCTPCRVELPHVERLHRSYADTGLDVVLVSEDAPSTAENVPAFLARFGVTARWVLDKESALLERFNPTANVPFTVVVDGGGKVLYAHAGFEPGDEDILEQVVRARVTRPPPRPSTVAVTASTQALGIHRTSRFDPVPENDGTLQAAVGRLEVRGATDRYTASARVDGAVVDDEVAGAVDRDARLERIQLAAGLGPARATAGDGYVAFGHGVSLSLRRIDQLGLDTSLRGGRLDVERPRFGVTAVAGIANPQNLDPIGLQIVGAEDGGVGPGPGPLCGADRRCDVLAGVQATAHVGDDLDLAPYALYAEAPEAAADGSDITWALGGASASGRAAGLRFAAEAAMGRRRGASLEPETPAAAYLSLQRSGERFTVLAAGKAYRDWEIGRSDRGLLYHEPPTLEREDQEVPSNDNVLGGQLRAEVRPAGAAATVFASALYYHYTQDGTDATSGEAWRAAHGYVGAEKRFGDAVSGSASAGYRREVDAAGDPRRTLAHVELDVAAELPRRLWRRPLAVTFKWNHREETKVVFNELEFRRGLGVLGVSVSGLAALSALYGYSTERMDGTAPTHYPGAELLVHLPRGGDLRLFGGRLAGGRICVSGSCRDVPPFEGARLDLIVRY